MNAPKVNESDYMQFLIAAQRVYICTEAEQVSPQAAAHDAYTRLLSRLPPDTEALWQEAERLVSLKGGVFVLDDSTLDKPYARQMELVTRHWSGKHRKVVSGINLQSLIWSDGIKVVPTDCRLYAKAEDDKTKHEHARAMFEVAQARGFAPELVMFDSWYSGLDNLKLDFLCNLDARLSAVVTNSRSLAVICFISTWVLLLLEVFHQRCQPSICLLTGRTLQHPISSCVMTGLENVVQHDNV